MARSAATPRVSNHEADDADGPGVWLSEDGNGSAEFYSVIASEAKQSIEADEWIASSPRSSQ
jgi:hypothetical protein